MSKALPWRIGAAFLPLGTGILGVINGLGEWQGSETLLQRISSAGVIVYGPLGLAAGVLLLAGARHGRLALSAWMVVVTIVGGVAPVAWGDAPAMFGLLSGFSTLLLCGAAYWAASEADARATPVTS
jgi:hypothetical protein